VEKLAGKGRCEENAWWWWLLSCWFFQQVLPPDPGDWIWDLDTDSPSANETCALLLEALRSTGPVIERVLALTSGGLPAVEPRDFGLLDCWYKSDSLGDVMERFGPAPILTGCAAGAAALNQSSEPPLWVVSSRRSSALNPSSALHSAILSHRKSLGDEGGSIFAAAAMGRRFIELMDTDLRGKGRFADF
jgi:hypothetical protein